MKTKQFFSGLVTGTVSLFFSMQAHAQDPMLHINACGNASIDHMAPTNQYLISGGCSPVTIGGWSNAATFGFLPRIQLQVLNNPMLATAMKKTYVTDQELMDVMEQRCTTLSVAFRQADAKQTADHGFILCGYVERSSEYSTCPGPAYLNPYLIKTDVNGNVVWYKRYDAGYGNRTRFNSVIEDPATGNFIVCGETTPGLGILPTAFMMGTSPTGNVMWASSTMTTRYGSPGTPENSTYTEITPFTDLMGIKYFVLTGAVGYSFYYPGINTGGGLLTVIDPGGAVVNNVYLTEDHVGRFMQLKGVHDAHDGEVVLTGFSGVNTCGVHDGFNVLVMKVNPLTLTTTFMKSFETNPGDMYHQSFGNSVTVTANAAGGQRVAVAGHQDPSGGGNYGLYVETDYVGNLLRYTPHNSLNAVVGAGVIFNPISNHTVYSGSHAGGTFVVKDKYGFACDPDVTPIPASLVNTVVLNNTVYTPVTEIAEVLHAFNLPNAQSLKCGAWKPGQSTAEEVKEVVSSNITLAPNPAENYIDVQLSNTMTNGTVKVYDMTGRLVLSGNAGDATSALRLDVATLAAGVYMVTAENKGIKEHASFVKQ